ncbi:MAG: ArsC family reductase [Proteobacteria bacterium]|nr:ArsC family reductase [Pseudomonadota bacterium]MDA1023926.1 ArsC family reductase [Pseudomonadota bacterium]
MISVYGLKNCDTCRNALKWLAENGMEHTFHDFRKDGLDAASQARWIKAVGWETLLNKRGTTWRGLPDGDKEGVDEARAAALMLAHPALIKRPVFEFGKNVFVGFKDEQRQALLKAPCRGS